MSTSALYNTTSTKTSMTALAAERSGILIGVAGAGAAVAQVAQSYVNFLPARDIVHPLVVATLAGASAYGGLALAPKVGGEVFGGADRADLITSVASGVAAGLVSRMYVNRYASIGSQALWVGLAGGLTAGAASWLQTMMAAKM